MRREKVKKLTALVVTILALLVFAIVPTLAQVDTDGDGRRDANDNCVCIANADQQDSDTDGRGNVCDNCVGNSNSNQRNSDDDDFGNQCDNCPFVANNDQDSSACAGEPPSGAIQGTSNGSVQYQPGGPWLPNAEMLTFHIHSLITPSGDTLPPSSLPDENKRWVYGLFDTGSTMVLLNPDAASYLGYTGSPSLLSIGIWGPQAIDPTTKCAPMRFPEITIPSVNLREGTDPTKPTLLGAPVTNNATAWIDYTKIIVRSLPWGTERNPAISFFPSGDPGIPTPLFWVDLEGTGAPAPPADGATVGERYLIRGMRFINGANFVASPILPNTIPAGAQFLYDTGNTATQITPAMASALGITGSTPIVDTIRRDGQDCNGYRITKVEIDAHDGSDKYVIDNALVFVQPAGLGGFAANIGANFFETTQVLFDGPGNRLGLFRGTKSGAPSPPQNLRIISGS
jgi:hypothetical protein